MDGRLPLHYAVCRERSSPDPNILAYLLRIAGGASVQQKDHAGRLPLHLLAAHKHLGVEEVEVLVDAWKDSVQEPDSTGLFPAHIAAAHDAPLSVVLYLALQCPEALVPRKIAGSQREADDERTVRPRKVPRLAYDVFDSPRLTPSSVNVVRPCFT